MLSLSLFASTTRNIWQNRAWAPAEKQGLIWMGRIDFMRKFYEIKSIRKQNRMAKRMPFNCATGPRSPIVESMQNIPPSTILFNGSQSDGFILSTHRGRRVYKSDLLARSTARLSENFNTICEECSLNYLNYQSIIHSYTNNMHNMSRIRHWAFLSCLSQSCALRSSSVAKVQIYRVIGLSVPMCNAHKARTLSAQPVDD